MASQLHMLLLCRSHYLKKPTKFPGILRYAIQHKINTESTQNQHNPVLCFFCGLSVFFKFSCPFPPVLLVSSLSLQCHTTVSCFFWPWEPLKEKWWERSPQPCKELARLLLVQVMSGRVPVLALVLQREDGTNWMRADWCKCMYPWVHM